MIRTYEESYRIQLNIIKHQQKEIDKLKETNSALQRFRLEDAGSALKREGHLSGKILKLKDENKRYDSELTLQCKWLEAEKKQTKKLKEENIEVEIEFSENRRSNERLASKLISLEDKNTKLQERVKELEKGIVDVLNWIKSDLAEESVLKIRRTMNPYRVEKIRFLNRLKQLLKQK